MKSGDFMAFLNGEQLAKHHAITKMKIVPSTARCHRRDAVVLPKPIQAEGTAAGSSDIIRLANATAAPAVSL